VIEIQLRLGKDLGAILAGVLVSKKDILPRELHFLSRNAIIKSQNNNLGNPKGHLDRMHQFGSRRLPFPASIPDPRSDIMCLISTFPLRLNHLGMTEAEKFQRPLYRASVHRLPQPIKDKDRTLKQYFHGEIRIGRVNTDSLKMRQS